MDPLGATANEIPYVRQAMVLLVSSIIAVAALQRLRISPVLAYLLAGIAIGPAGLALIANVEAVRTFAELGVVFLLFTVGLQLSVDRIKALRQLVLGLGGLQVVLSGAAVAALVYLLYPGARGPELIVIGGALALSSTAVVMQILIERGEAASRLGRVSFAVLLLQDLAVVPLLVLATVMSGDGETVGTALALAILKALVAVGTIVVVGHYALRWPFRWVAATRSAELFMALALLVVLATGWITHMAGLSMALGAFLAGLLLAETEFRPQVETDVAPFKDLLIGLFFMAIGMSIDVGLVSRQAPALIGAVLGLVALKTAIVVALCIAFRQSKDVAIRAGLLLGPGGEFGFVLVTTALAGDVLARETAQFLLAMISISILLTPLVAVIGTRLGDQLMAAQAHKEHGTAHIGDGDHADHVIIAGFGRVGQTVAQLIGRQKVPFVAIDLDPNRVTRWREQGHGVYYGDASREDVLDRLGAEHAAALIVTLDDPQAAQRTLSHVQRRWPRLPAFVRAHDGTHLTELRNLGATAVVPETLESSLLLARHALNALGTPAEAAERLVSEVRAAGNAPSTGKTPVDAGH